MKKEFFSRLLTGSTILGLAITYTSHSSPAVPFDDHQICGTNPQVDHYMVGVPNLKVGAEKFENQTGIKPQFGGVHTGGATANYLVSLGDCQYLELVGPNPDGPNDNEMSQQLKALSHPRLLGIAYAMRNLEKLLTIAQDRKLTIGTITPGGRQTPDGQDLNWRTLSFNASGGFFIDWLDTPHPSTTTPMGIKVSSFSIEWPHADDLKNLHKVIGLTLPIQQAEHGRYSLTLEGPKGSVTYSSQ